MTMDRTMIKHVSAYHRAIARRNAARELAIDIIETIAAICGAIGIVAIVALVALVMGA